MNDNCIVLDKSRQNRTDYDEIRQRSTFWMKLSIYLKTYSVRVPICEPYRLLRSPSTYICMLKVLGNVFIDENKIPYYCDQNDVKEYSFSDDKVYDFILMLLLFMVTQD